MKLTISILAFLIQINFCHAQDYRTLFAKSLEQGDTIRQREILSVWEKEDSNNAELFTCYFNFYLNKSRQELMTLTKDEPDGESLSFHDSTGTTAGYLGSQITYDPNTFQKAIHKIDEGIKQYPNRLDMRFGKIYALGEAGNWTSYTDEIIKTITYSTSNNNNWTWTNNIKKENGKDFLFSSLQDYQVKLYNTEDDRLLENMRAIANEILKIYPDHIESLSNLSVTYLLTKKYDEAIDVLLKAEKIAPKDAIVLGNIAQAYKLKGDKKRAIAYYEKVVMHGDKDSRGYATQQIEELKTK